jgi:hypothetical protein
MLDLFGQVFILMIDEQTQLARLAAEPPVRTGAARQQIRDGRHVLQAQMLAQGAIPLDGTASPKGRRGPPLGSPARGPAVPQTRLHRQPRAGPRGRCGRAALPPSQGADLPVWRSSMMRRRGEVVVVIGHLPDPAETRQAGPAPRPQRQRFTSPSISPDDHSRSPVVWCAPARCRIFASADRGRSRKTARADARVMAPRGRVPVRIAARYRQMAPGSGFIDGSGGLRVLMCAPISRRC